MEQGISKKKSIIFGLIFIGLVIGMTIKALRGYSLEKLINTIESCNPYFITLAIGCGLLFLFCEAVNIRRPLKLLGYKVKVSASIKYAVVGFFFSGITPSATGGQPMQLFYMIRDGIKVSQAVVTLLVDVISFQLTGLLIGIIGFFTLPKIVMELSLPFRGLILLGFVVNIIFAIGMIMFIFAPKKISNIILRIVRLGNKFKFIKKKNMEQKIEESLDTYKESAECMRNNKGLTFKTLLTSTVQTGLYYSIPFFILKAMGIETVGWLEVVLIQGILTNGVGFIPLPGGIGINELGFTYLYKNLLSAGIISPLVILYRGISFYLLIALTGTIIFVSEGKKLIEKSGKSSIIKPERR